MQATHPVNLNWTLFYGFRPRPLNFAFCCLL